MLAGTRSLPFVTTLHGTDITLVGLDRSYLPITRFAIEQSDGVTAISNYLREETVRDFSIERPIEVIPNFVNCDLYKPLEGDRELARRRYAQPNEKVLLHLSNFRPVKRLLDVIEIFSLVAQKVPARLILAGDGPDRSAAEWLARQKNLHDRVVFLGKMEQVHELLPLADLMLMPSELESFGLAALEAMACKVPTIATRVGGVPELIDDGVSGRLFSVGDIAGMAGAAIELLTNPDALKAMSEACRVTARERFCASRIIPIYERYYEKVLEGA
jgi:N-acetyl-alpha-D-glucosaminyl L-malate synthase BshA